MKQNMVHRIALIFLLCWLAIFFMSKIDLTTADLGRHIKNGELILQGEFGILNSNFYSYTEPDYKVVNHHWGAGVIFYIIHQSFGFEGLSVFYLVLSLITFYIFFRIAVAESNLAIAAIWAAFLIPLIGARSEIRPEIFSYVFIALFFFILWRYAHQQIAGKWLLVLPLIMLIWVNTHIYFIFGYGLIGLYWLVAVIKNMRENYLKRPASKKHRFFTSLCSTQNDSRKLGLILLLTIVASLLNPFFVKGLIYPFNIFKNYGYTIVENKSVWFLENWGWQNPNLRLFEISLGLLILSFVLVLAVNRKKLSLTYLILGALWGALGWLAIRNFTLYGLFALPIMTYNFQQVFQGRLQLKTLNAKAGWAFLVLVVALVGFSVQKAKLPLTDFHFGFGLLPGNNQSVEFFKANKLRGPLFNNYDLGGYLIYHLWPMERVFTDNRPEAYSASHFQDDYIASQLDNDKWQVLVEKYNFNVIYFSHRDYTNWGQNFLVERVKDRDWIPIYVDMYNIIFVRNVDQNRALIDQYEIDPARFGIGNQSV